MRKIRFNKLLEGFSMEKIKARTLSGFMELLPGAQMQMERIMEIIR